MQNMKNTIVLSLFLILAKNSIASDTLYFAGSIKITKSIAYKYFLKFTIDKENQLHGYSLSDPGGPSETKTKISGSFDSVKKTISFQENIVLRSKVDLKSNDLCFVRATLVLNKNKLVETLSGNFSGFKIDKVTECANGKINLINTDRAKVILNTWDEQNKFNENSKKIALENSGKLLTLINAKGKSLHITGNTVKLIVWDNGQVDGDKISITLNGINILNDYTLAAEAKVMEVPLSGNDVDTLQIIALNVGTIAPNTAVIKIETPVEQYPILTKAVLNEVRTIYLTKK